MRRHLCPTGVALAVILGVGITANLAGAAAKPLSAQVLSLSQMPSGWLAESNSNTGVGCLHDLLEPSGVTQTQVAEVYFVHSGDVPFLDEKVATYSNVKTAFKKISGVIAACPDPTGTYKGYPSTGTVTSFSFHPKATQSVAYQMVFKTGHVTVYYDYVIARKKNAIVAVLVGSYPAVSTSQFTSFVTKALAKVTS
jgi:hypothetical protein